MTRNHRSLSVRAVTLAMAVALAGTMATGVALATGGSSKTFTACSTSKGVLSLVTAKGTCKSGTSKVTLGARGPKGRPGNTGSQGIQGIQGVPGDQGPAGPDLPGHLDVLTSPSFDKGANPVTLADLSLPKGTFMITGTVVLHGDANSNAINDVTCELDAGLSEDKADVTIPAGSGYADVTLVAASTYVNTGDSTLECNNHNTAVFADSARIMAVPAGSVSYATT